MQKVLRCLDSAGHLDLQQLFAAPFTSAETPSTATAAATAHAVVHEAATTAGGAQRSHAAIKAKQQNLRGTSSRATAKGSRDLAHASSTAPAGSSDRDSGTARLPVKLEICSGAGRLCSALLCAATYHVPHDSIFTPGKLPLNAAVSNESIAHGLLAGFDSFVLCVGPELDLMWWC